MAITTARLGQFEIGRKATVKSKKQKGKGTLADTMIGTVLPKVAAPIASAIGTQIAKKIKGKGKPKPKQPNAIPGSMQKGDGYKLAGTGRPKPKTKSKQRGVIMPAL